MALQTTGEKHERKQKKQRDDAIRTGLEAVPPLPRRTNTPDLPPSPAVAALTLELTIMSAVAYISATDLADRWDVCRPTVIGWCKAGLIPGACKVGPTGLKGLHWPQWRIPLQWVAEGERKSVKQLQKEIAASIKQRKRRTWDKTCVYLEKGKKRD